jgi:hypothetical protein
VRDLAGASVEAIPHLERVLSAAPSPLAHEVRYNLAIACYHRYHANDVDRAIELFSDVIASKEAPASLRLLARAGRAQAFAMRMIPRFPHRPDLNWIKGLFERVITEKQDALQELKTTRDATVALEVHWMVHNAAGMSLMYFSDYFGDTVDKIKLVRQSLDDLTAADQHSPKNWANYCDLGSAHMRLGYWSDRDPAELEKALDYLRQVVDGLRPNYGFALYEIGRAYRINRQFDHAQEWLLKSRAIPYEIRDVGDKRIEFEIALTLNKDATYPASGIVDQPRDRG